jgi:hypothetical protein
MPGEAMIKVGVDLRGLHPVWGVAYPVVVAVFTKYGYEHMVTSGTEKAPDRLPHSKHYEGKALDFRLRHVRQMDKANIVKDVKDSLGLQFDVVHKNPGTDREHLHVEFDPKDTTTSSGV